MPPDGKNRPTKAEVNRITAWVRDGARTRGGAFTAKAALTQEDVLPILFTRCVVCHAGEGRVGFLEELSQGATTWDEAQSRSNFESVSRLVTPGNPLASRLLMHPLEPEAGGDEFHNGGRQFSSQEDPDFQTLAAWVSGETGQ